MLSRVDLSFFKKNTYWISNRRKKSNWEGRFSFIKISFFLSEYIFDHFYSLDKVWGLTVTFLRVKQNHKYKAQLVICHGHLDSSIRAGRCSFVIWFIFGHFNFLNPFIMATPVEWIATDVLEKYFASLRNWFLSHFPYWNKVLGQNVTDISVSWNNPAMSGTYLLSISSKFLTMSVTYLHPWIFWQCMWNIYIIKYSYNVCDIVRIISYSDNVCDISVS